jgi:phytoene dehydrogenase-like protein
VTPPGTATYDAVVVGAGVNGLVAAARLAREGWGVLVLERAERVGGSCASDVFGDLVRDTCAAIHPFGVSSPAFAALDLAAHGLAWAHPPVAVAHPLDDGRAAVLAADLRKTLDLLGRDGARYRRTIGALAGNGGAAIDALTGPVLRAPRRRGALTVRALLGPLAALPATVAARALFREPAHQALWAGLAAHAATRLDTPLSNAPAVGMAVAGHVGGWPAARGGSQAITDALAAVVRAARGEIHTAVTVRSLRQLPPEAGNIGGGEINRGDLK